MTIAMVGTPTTFESDTSATTIPCAAKNTTTGNLIVVNVAYEDFNVTISSVTDTAGNTYTPCQALVKHSTFLMFTRQYYCLNATGNAANVVTANLSGSADFRSIHVAEYSGDGLAFDNASSAETTAATSISFSPNPTSSGNSVVHAAGASWIIRAQTNTVGGYTDDPESTNSLQQWHVFRSSSGAFTSTFTTSLSDDEVFVWAIFKEVIGAGGGKPSGPFARKTYGAGGLSALF